MERIVVPRDVIAALIINTKKLCGRLSYTSIRECSYFERELKNIFLLNKIDSIFDEKLSNDFKLSDDGFITTFNDNYNNMFITFFNSSSDECKAILNNTLVFVDILIKYLDREKTELSMLKKEVLNFKEKPKTR